MGALTSSPLRRRLLVALAALAVLAGVIALIVANRGSDSGSPTPTPGPVATVSDGEPGPDPLRVAPAAEPGSVSSGTLDVEVVDLSRPGNAALYMTQAVDSQLLTEQQVNLYADERGRDAEFFEGLDFYLMTLESRFVDGSELAPATLVPLLAPTGANGAAVDSEPVLWRETATAKDHLFSLASADPLVADPAIVVKTSVLAVVPSGSPGPTGVSITRPGLEPIVLNLD